MFARQSNRSAVALYVLQTRRTIADVYLEFPLRFRVQLAFDELEKQALRVAAAVAAEVRNSIQDCSEFGSAHGCHIALTVKMLELHSEFRLI